MKLFDTDKPTREWVNLRVAGLKGEVPGTQFSDTDSVCCGVPLGGIGTGCIDFNVEGVFGWRSIFHPVSQTIPDAGYMRMPRKLPPAQPVFGLAAGGEVHVLTTEAYLRGGRMPWCAAPYNPVDSLAEPRRDDIQCPAIEGVKAAKSIRYYGHYPVADAEYELDAPLSAGVRAWSPFVVGQSALSNIPAALFDVYVRNLSDAPQACTLAMNFPGPDREEAQGASFRKTEIREDVRGVLVASEGGMQYAMGVYGMDARTGSGLCRSDDPACGYGMGRFGKPDGWKDIAARLPPNDRFLERNGEKLYRDPSASVAVDFTLAPHEEKVIPFVLSWYAPVMEASLRDPKGKDDYCEWEWLGDPWQGELSHHAPMYAARYGGALDVCRRLYKDKDMILRKILAWQQALLGREDLPGWLRDSLLNILCQLAEDGYWFQPKYPLGDWCFPGGAFGYFESTRDCPHTSCIPGDMIATMHLCYLFPELYRAMLDSYRAAQRPDGEIPFAAGKCGDLANLLQPEYFWQVSLNGACFVIMVDRLWQVTRDDGVVRDFYDSVKRCNDFTLGLSKDGILAIADRGGSEWFEHSKFYGLVTHIGGLHLCQMLLVERMARLMGDTDYADSLRAIYEKERVRMEDKLWLEEGGYYLNWLHEANGRRNDDVMTYQLDGFFAARMAGLPENVFRDDRIRKVLDLVYRTSVKLGNGFGALNYARPDGRPIGDGTDAYGSSSIFTQSTVMLSMMYLFTDQRERGMELAYSTWKNLVLNQGLHWDMTHIVHARDGHKMFGADYNQQGVVWQLPMAILGQDVAGPARPGGVAYEMLRAARETR